MTTGFRSGLFWVAMALCSPLIGPPLWALNLWVDRRSRRRRFQLKDCPDVDVVVVLGAKLDPQGAPSLALVSRLQTATALLRAGGCGTLLVSGDDGHRAGQDERGAMMRWLRDAGVSSVELDSPARRTLESVLALRRRSEIKLAFCSQDQHLARTMWLCDLCGVPAIGLRAPEPRSSATWRSSAYGALANVKVLVDWLRGPARRGERSP